MLRKGTRTFLTSSHELKPTTVERRAKLMMMNRVFNRDNNNEGAQRIYWYTVCWHAFDGWKPVLPPATATATAEDTRAIVRQRSAGLGPTKQSTRPCSGFVGMGP